MAYDTEFRSKDDEAWYTVELNLLDERREGGGALSLHVKFQGFNESSDLYFSPENLAGEADLDDLVGRFRPLSSQLQDSQCSAIAPGMIVCAACAPVEYDVRFYDALVEYVHRQEHSFAGSEEECLCTFVLTWLHGPNKDYMTSVGIASICIIQDNAIHGLNPAVAAFAELAREKVRRLQTASLNSKHDPVELENDSKFGSEIQTSEGRSGIYHSLIERDYDSDLGGESLDMKDPVESSSLYFVIIENLEKGLSPSSIREFIQRETSISIQAYVFPGLASEPYTRGAILLDCKERLQNMYEFLNNPNHLIVSAQGRPWVLQEKLFRRATFRTMLGGLVPRSQEASPNNAMGKELKVVHSGTEAFRNAEKLRDLFVELGSHVKKLNRTFVREEQRILKSSASVSFLEKQ